MGTCTDLLAIILVELFLIIIPAHKDDLEVVTARRLHFFVHLGQLGSEPSARRTPGDRGGDRDDGGDE